MKEEKKGNKHSKFEPVPYARKQAQQIWYKPLRDLAIQIKKNLRTPNLVKPKNKNDFQTGIYP